MLVSAVEVEAAGVGAAGHRELANRQHIKPAGDVFPNRFLICKIVTVLVDKGHTRGFSDHHFTAVGFFLAGNQFEQCRFTGTVGADDADDGAGRHLKAQVVDQQSITERLADALELDDLVAQALGHGNENFVGFNALLVFEIGKFFKPGKARLAFGLTRFWVLARPFKFFLQRLGSGFFALLLGRQALAFLLQPAAVVAFPWNAVAAVQLENPFSGIVEKVAVVGDGHHSSGKALQKLLQPVNRLGIEVIGRLVEQQHVGPGQQQAAKRNAAFFAA